MTEKHQLVASHRLPDRGSNLQPFNVQGQCSNSLSHPAGAETWMLTRVPTLVDLGGSVSRLSGSQGVDHV